MNVIRFNRPGFDAGWVVVQEGWILTHKGERVLLGKTPEKDWLWPEKSPATKVMNNLADAKGKK